MKNSTQNRNAEPHVFDAGQQKMLQQVSEDFPSKVNHFRKAYRGSLRSAITAKCCECVWGRHQGHPGVRRDGLPALCAAPLSRGAAMNRHGPEIMKLIKLGKLFPASKLLPPEKAKAPRAAAEVRHAQRHS